MDTSKWTNVNVHKESKEPVVEFTETNKKIRRHGIYNVGNYCNRFLQLYSISPDLLDLHEQVGNEGISILNKVLKENGGLLGLLKIVLCRTIHLKIQIFREI